MRRELATSNFSSFLFPLLIFRLISEIQARRLQQVVCSSSCGDIKNISYPFRLKGDPARCGDHHYELSCQSNKTILEFLSGKYLVKRISYAERIITVVDFHLANGSCSLPQKSLSVTEIYDDNRYLISFELSCFNNNTLLQIPSSSSNSSHAFYVQEISYLHSSFTIIDADETTCPVKTLFPAVNLTGSKFAFSQSALGYTWAYALMNCTEKIAQRSSLIEEVVLIDCISDDKNVVYAIRADESMDTLPSTCSRWRIASIPVLFGFINDVKYFFKTGRMAMVWEALDGCYGCELSGKYCGFNFLTNSTICVKIKGNKNIHR
ncbi:hypothetical protein JRO89_XS05G0206700 [Xanthoceras sorbifolium]|uniref:RING-type E3 ubiquitin transferase n=1 Tax=Xanthoceras sorbifolium TaxID=99658 RepID=A0ABQ8I2G8_9ROSI|nr:hypothetical protein JRO89_XS05G0206700 [Xanthoceras sorbifolium]